MPYLEKNDFMARLKERFGEDTSDETLSILEDASDTYDELSSRGSEDWKQKYEENDASWREKYHERFFTSGEEVIKNQRENVIEDGEPRTFEELFKEREG